MADTESADPLIGKYVIVRTSAGGVHAGLLKSYEGRQAHLTEGRRLWRWRVNGNKGVSLSDVANFGLDSRDTKISSPVEVLLTENCEIIVCSEEAALSIAQFATYEPR